MKQPIKSRSIVPRIDGIQRDGEKRRKLPRLSLTDLGEEDNSIRAQFHLRPALEGVFHPALTFWQDSQVEGATEYKTIGLKLGEVEIVPQHFAAKILKAMASYRNRLTHFYADIAPRRLAESFRRTWNEVSTFLKAVKGLLLNPGKLNLTVE